MYDYPLDPDWSTEEIIDVVKLYNAVEKAYEEGISSKEFMEQYRTFTSIADSKSLQKQLDKAFEEASGYSIYKVFKRAQEEEWVKL
nr:UPF0223 family protein [Catenibacterium mitsuokai]